MTSIYGGFEGKVAKMSIVFCFVQNGSKWIFLVEHCCFMFLHFVPFDMHRCMQIMFLQIRCHSPPIAGVSVLFFFCKYCCRFSSHCRGACCCCFNFFLQILLSFFFRSGFASCFLFLANAGLILLPLWGRLLLLLEVSRDTFCSRFVPWRRATNCTTSKKPPFPSLLILSVC